MKAGLLLTLVLALPARAEDCVVLLHGLARSADSMEAMALALDEVGFHSVNIGYPSREYPVEELARTAIPEGIAGCEGRQQIHFVTHSMGGILVRQYLSENPLPELGRVVMLGPPNQGSEVVDTLGDVPGFTWLNGDAGLQLGTAEDSLVNNLGPASFDLGVIAGNRSINLVLSGIIPGEDDGKVAVDNARVDGMQDFLVVPVSHPFLMKNDEVIRQTIHYLEHGRFNHDPAGDNPN